MKKKKEQQAIVPKFEKPKHSVRFLLNERAKDHRKKSNLMKKSKSLLTEFQGCLLYTSPSPRDATLSRMPSSA